mmetsp:Transcript_11876/g.28318  ORF Transcript_11876/g.28318 Transcript_11876/m.28318 type:complete len:249 (+) Transcript_11876:66-812(+)
MSKATSFYVDCTHAAGSLEYVDGHAEGCAKINDLWQNRRVTDKGPERAPCRAPEYVHAVDTGEWAECCRSPLMHPDDEEGPMANFWKLLAAVGLRKGHKEVYICQPLTVLHHNYSYDMASGVGWIQDPCGDCAGSDEICLKPRVFDIKSYTFPTSIGDGLKQAARAIGRKLLGLDRKVCLGVGYNWSFGRIAPGMLDMIRSLPWGDKRKVYYVDSEAAATLPLQPSDFTTLPAAWKRRVRRIHLQNFL